MQTAWALFHNQNWNKLKKRGERKTFFTARIPYNRLKCTAVFCFLNRKSKQLASSCGAAALAVHTLSAIMPRPAAPAFRKVLRENLVAIKSSSFKSIVFLYIFQTACFLYCSTVPCSVFSASARSFSALPVPLHRGFHPAE